jgi:hypothetical protein
MRSPLRSSSFGGSEQHPDPGRRRLSCRPIHPPTYPRIVCDHVLHIGGFTDGGHDSGLGFVGTRGPEISLWV